MPVGPGVTRCRHRQLLAFEDGTGGDAGDGLQRLEAGARQDQRIGIPVSCDDLAVRREHHCRARVTGFDESAPLDDGEFHGILHSQSLQHQTSLPSGRAALVCVDSTSGICFTSRAALNMAVAGKRCLPSISRPVDRACKN